jgi:hypothetical protein
MREHTRIVGGLYVAWAFIQTMGIALLLATRASTGAPRPPALAAALGLAIAVAFLAVGLMLWRRDPRARTPSIGLAIVALLSFPAGTALGAYALWVFLRRAAPTRAPR